MRRKLFAFDVRVGITAMADDVISFEDVRCCELARRETAGCGDEELCHLIGGVALPEAEVRDVEEIGESWPASGFLGVRVPFAPLHARARPVCC
jgi:hypothetical protein